MNIQLTDSTGSVLTLTTDRAGHAFDTVTCSPRLRGFTVLNGSIDRRVPQYLVDACNETRVRNEVCILPAFVSTRWRVLLTPTVHNVRPESRVDTAKLMKDLFEASQTSEVRATGLKITHFAHVRSYPEPHVLGILDALRDLAGNSYRHLKVLGIEFRQEHVPEFERNVRDVFAAALP